MVLSHVPSQHAEGKIESNTSTCLSLTHRTSLFVGVENNQASHSGLCYEIAVIRDGTQSRPVIACGGEDRIKHIYMSKSNSIELQIKNRRLLATVGAFLIKYQGKHMSSI